MRFTSLLTAGILGFAGFTATNVSFAKDISSTFSRVGFYAGLQGGRSDTFYKGKTFGQAAAATNITQLKNYDNEPLSNYYTITTTGESMQLSAAQIDDIGIGGRIYAGYQFNPYFALETGYTQYAKTTFSYASTTTQNINLKVTHPDDFVPYYNPTSSQVWTTQHNGEITENAIDLVAKGTVPLGYGMGIYAKAGAAYIQSKTTNRAIAKSNIFNSYGYTAPENGLIYYTGDGPANNPFPEAPVVTHTSQAFRPVAGIGINYTVPHSNASVDASYTRVFSSGDIPQAALLALGVEYKFD
jgi:hypothetical protein